MIQDIDKRPISMIQQIGTAGLAQSVERIHGKDEVAGSIPATSIAEERSLEKIQASFFASLSLTVRLFSTIFKKTLTSKEIRGKVRTTKRKEKTIMNKVDVLMTQLNTQLLQSQLSSM